MTLSLGLWKAFSNRSNPPRTPSLNLCKSLGYCNHSSKATALVAFLDLPFRSLDLKKDIPKRPQNSKAQKSKSTRAIRKSKRLTSWIFSTPLFPKVTSDWAGGQRFSWLESFGVSQDVLKWTWSLQKHETFQRPSSFSLAEVLGILCRTSEKMQCLGGEVGQFCHCGGKISTFIRGSASQARQNLQTTESRQASLLRRPTTEAYDWSLRLSHLPWSHVILMVFFFQILYVNFQQID